LYVVRQGAEVFAHILVGHEVSNNQPTPPGRGDYKSPAHTCFTAQVMGRDIFAFTSWLKTLGFATLSLGYALIGGRSLNDVVARAKKTCSTTPLHFDST